VRDFAPKTRGFLGWFTHLFREKFGEKVEEISGEFWRGFAGKIGEKPGKNWQGFQGKNW
jgi:hypothetical protein